MESEMVITGAIVDSWVESAQATSCGPRLVLQVLLGVGRRTW